MPPAMKNADSGSWSNSPATSRSNDEIGAALAISTRTVETHLRRIFERLGIGSRTELTARALREGWLDLPGS